MIEQRADSPCLMHTITLETLKQVISFESCWTSLAKEHAQSVFQMPGWAIQWLRILGSGSKPNCVVVMDCGTVLGLAPLMISNKRGIKLMEFIGSFLNDYNAFLFPPELAGEVGTRIFAELTRNAVRWDLFKVPAIDDVGLALGVDNFESLGLRFRIVGDEQSPAFELPFEWDHYIARLPKKRLRSLEYLRRCLISKEACEFVVSTDPSEILSHIDEFERNRLQSWQARNRIAELPRLITTERFSRFLKEIASNLPTTNGLRFAFLRKDTRIIAAGIYFSANARLMKYMQSWNYDYAHLSPGTVLDWMVIRYAIENGFRFFDFGQGDEEYKFRFGADRRPLRSAVITRFDSDNLCGFIQP